MALLSPPLSRIIRYATARYFFMSDADVTLMQTTENVILNQTRKDFLELSIDYFLRTGFDIRGEAFDLSPLERITDRLESSAKVMEQHNEGTEVVRQLLQVVQEQTAKQLPAPDLIAHAAEERARAEAKSQEQEKEIQRIKEENIRLCNKIKELVSYKERAYRELCRVRDEQKTIGKIKVNTDL